MSFLGKIFGVAAGETVKGMAEGIGGLAKNIRYAITGDMPPELKFKLEELAIQADAMAMQGQVSINAIEAQSASTFVAGWRPFIGWVCGLALGWHFLLYPMVIWGMSIWAPELSLPPSLNLDQLYPVIIGMLGLGLFRTYEKAKDVQSNH